MSRRISFIRTGSGNLSLIVDGKSLPPIRSDHPNYTEICQAITADAPERLQELCDFRVAVVAHGNGRIRYAADTDSLTLDSAPLHHSLHVRIRDLQRIGLPFEHLVLFLERLYKNPSRRAVNELYGFLEQRGIPITDDGCFLGYKRFRPDWTDCHTGTIKSEFGVEVRVERNTVDDNWGLDCSEGLHVGSREYVNTFNDRQNPPFPIGIVKVDPADVVTVPRSETTKLRTCAYTLIAEDVGVMDKSPIYSTGSGAVTPVVSSPTNPTESDLSGDYSNDDLGDDDLIEDHDLDDEDDEDHEDDEEDIQDMDDLGDEDDEDDEEDIQDMDDLDDEDDEDHEDDEDDEDDENEAGPDNKANMSSQVQVHDDVLSHAPITSAPTTQDTSPEPTCLAACPDVTTVPEPVVERSKSRKRFWPFG